jgi:hypothetical protein
MPAYPGFIGPTAEVRSRKANAERTINWYLEQAPGTPASPGWLVPTPGVRPFITTDTDGDPLDGPIRALFAQDGRMWAISGSSLYEVFASQTAINRGTALSDGRPATICSSGANGNQLFIVSGGIGYIYDLTTNAVAPVTTNAEPVQMGCFSDGYFVALKQTSNQFNISELYDGLTWDLLDVYQVSQMSDQTVTLIESHRDLWLLGSKYTSIWSNTGDADNPFQPAAGIKVDQGSAAFSAVNLDNTIFWLGGNENGDRVVYRARGYTPEPVSSVAVSYALNLYPRVYDAIGYGYQEEGHTFYALYLPSVPNRPGWHTTWFFDVATGQWHERALWDTTACLWKPHYGRCHCVAFGRHFLGSRGSGAIYEVRLDQAYDRLVD